MIKSLSQTTSCFCLSEVRLDHDSIMWLTSDTEQKHTFVPNHFAVLFCFFCSFLIYSRTVSQSWLCGQKWNIYIINCSLLLKTDVNVKKQNLCTVLSQLRSDMGKNHLFGRRLEAAHKKKKSSFLCNSIMFPAFALVFVIGILSLWTWLAIRHWWVVTHACLNISDFQVETSHLAVTDRARNCFSSQTCL